VGKLQLTGLITAIFWTFACASTPGLKRQMGPKFAEETASWQEIIKTNGQSGMWLVTRGYHTGDDVVAVATNAAFSHASILDQDKGTVIEAIAEGVIETPLDKFLSETHRVVLVEPKGWTPEIGKDAVNKARAQLGKSYDFLGTVGAPKEDRWYCSELAVWTMGIKVNEKGAKKVFHPKALMELGSILFDSKDRDGEPDSVEE